MNTDEPTAEQAPPDSASADTTDLVAAAAAQLVEHVDEDGAVIEIVTRAEMRARTCD